MSSKPVKKPGVKEDKTFAKRKYSVSTSQRAASTAGKATVKSNAGFSLRDASRVTEYAPKRPVSPNLPKHSDAALSKAIGPVMEKLKAQETEIAALKKGLARMKATQEAKENTYQVPQSLAELKPRRLPPPGKTAMEMIQGQWPGEETTEELLAQLKALD